MLVKFIEMPAKNVLYFQASAIRQIHADPKNPLITLIVTNMMTPQGWQTFAVLGGADDAARRVNDLLSGKYTD